TTDARDCLALLRRVGGGWRAADPRADESRRVRALRRPARSAARAAPRCVERRPCGAECRARSRGHRDRVPGDAGSGEHHRHPLGRAAGRDDLRRSCSADPRDPRPQPPGGAVRARDRAGRAQGSRACPSDRGRVAVMTATLSMVPVAQIRPSKANPRAEFDDERMAELIESVKRHGIITPLTLSQAGDGRYAIIAGERRYRAAKAAKLREVPAQVREVDGEALTLALAENVIRADLSPLEEARAYRRLIDEHGAAAKVAKLVGKSERLVSERLDLLRLPERTQELLAARRVPLACAPRLVEIAEREPLLADLTAAWLA